ncbi:phasin family protein [Paraburkholderia pallida]|uniref:Phasin family protein n=1 Tax=Paraburkholderia pallida TaxID=2547399 RepID=A0A4P7DB44_9BURK|nr:phasin family protein [Paraburkholderia pallida]QBR04012.1 phasin family protein [Paraburkholderia pallida]
MQIQEQLAASQKANLDMLFTLTSGIVEALGKLAELNMQTIRSTLQDAIDQTQRALSVKEPQQWPALQDSLAAPMAEKVQTYSRQLFEIGAEIKAESARYAHAQWEAYGNRAKVLMEDVAKGTPAGSEAALAALDSAFTAASTLYGTLEKTGRQAVEVTRSNFDAAAAASSKSARRGVASEAQAAKR